MTHDAASQLRRLLHLIPRLADGESHSLAAVAKQMRTDTGTLLRDLQSLSARFGPEPGGFTEGVQIFLEPERVSVRTSHFARPMRLTGAELAALELGLAMLRAERPPEEHRAIEGARERLRAALARVRGRDVHDGLRHAQLGATGDPARFAEIRRAVRERRKLRLTYRRAHAAEAGERLALPYALVVARGAWYLVAHCESSDGLRIFRLDRVERAEGTAERFTLPAGFSVEAVVRDGRVFHAEEARRLTVRYSPRVARWIAEREGAELAADGSLTLEHPLADAEWAVRHVLQYGPDAEVVAPDELRAAVRGRLEAMLG